MTWLRRWLRGRRSAARSRRGGGGDLRALLSLDDRTLADIGLRRPEIAAVAIGQLPLSQLTLRGPIGPSDDRPLAPEPASAGHHPELEPWHAAA